MRIKIGKHDFHNTVCGHGWYQLAPFGYDRQTQMLATVAEFEGSAYEFSIRSTGKSLVVEAPDFPDTGKHRLADTVRHILRLDEPFDELFEIVSKHEKYRWLSESGRGPLLRSPTVFEDLIKTVCTTNCSWSLTKLMTTRLVETLGNRAKGGLSAFPNASEMAKQTAGFYEKEIKAGYRSGYLLEIAESVASGKVDCESWLNSELETDELKKEIKSLKGVGDYAAEHMLKMVGRYDHLALDSYLRGGFYKVYNKGKNCPDSKIERHYKRFGRWKGLVIWFDMVENAD
ncbi:MAG: hypothetical protein R2684_16260 [Pyrinomonadaceae bacterium]